MHPAHTLCSYGIVEYNPNCESCFLNLHSAGTFRRACCTVFQNLHRTAGQELGMSLPLSARGFLLRATQSSAAQGSSEEGGA